MWDDPDNGVSIRLVFDGEGMRAIGAGEAHDLRRRDMAVEWARECILSVQRECS